MVMYVGDKRSSGQCLWMAMGIKGAVWCKIWTSIELYCKSSQSSYSDPPNAAVNISLHNPDSAIRNDYTVQWNSYGLSQTLPEGRLTLHYTIQYCAYRWRIDTVNLVAWLWEALADHTVMHVLHTYFHVLHKHNSISAVFMSTVTM
jgi:hypothetical protein